MVCWCGAVLAQDWNKTPYDTKSLAGSAINNVFVSTSGGSILVSGDAGQSPRIEVYIHGNNNANLSRDEIRKRLEDDYDLEISVSNHQLHALAKRKHDGFSWNWRRNLNISFRIYVPKNVDTHLETSGGSIHLDNLNGNENFSTSGGSLHVDALMGMIKGETSGGSIEINHSGNNIDMETSGGSIHAGDCHGHIKLETSGGSLSLENLKGDIHAETSGGSIHANNIDGEFVTGTSGGSVNLENISGSLDASTSGGGMNVSLNHVGKYVKLDVSGGHVNLRLPAGQGYDLNLSAERISSASPNKFSGEWGKDHVHGSLNGGGIPVDVDAGGHLDISFN